MGVMAAGLAGCSESNEFTGYDKAAAEYRDAAGDLTLPQGAKPFPGLPEPKQKTSYQNGVGLVTAQYFWRCSWEKEWLDSQGSDKTRAGKALAELKKSPSMDFMSKDHLDDTGRSMFTEYMDKAELGDPSGFQQHYSANCIMPGQSQ
ncbi:hypothetical protein [Streptomyces sp. H39-C1]|uniref:hypothetical protein n=1 Tax=Streptomyces sp. H39-C1 TaxID=3004355 RepID=UPI0022AE7A39|nr:hypothetical protein [Streptomyces sp. H39-C1]MCZ4101163.1 hypothetical protein [Streptomyces sp. H39-C1]